MKCKQNELETEFRRYVPMLTSLLLITCATLRNMNHTSICGNNFIRSFQINDNHIWFLSLLKINDNSVNLNCCHLSFYASHKMTIAKYCSQRHVKVVKLTLSWTERFQNLEVKNYVYNILNKPLIIAQYIMKVQLCWTKSNKKV